MQVSGRLVVLGARNIRQMENGVRSFSVRQPGRVLLASRPRRKPSCLMISRTLQQLIPVIQMAVGPVILISGVGLLLLSMTNRFGRVIDRSRLLARELPAAAATEREHLSQQLAVLYRRAKIIRLAIILATASVLLAGLLIISLFLAALLHLEAALLVALCFILCMASLVGSLIAFLFDLQVSLTALRMELAQAGFGRV